MIGFLLATAISVADTLPLQPKGTFDFMVLRGDKEYTSQAFRPQRFPEVGECYILVVTQVGKDGGPPYTFNLQRTLCLSMD